MSDNFSAASSSPSEAATEAEANNRVEEESPSSQMSDRSVHFTGEIDPTSLAMVASATAKAGEAAAEYLGDAMGLSKLSTPTPTMTPTATPITTLGKGLEGRCGECGGSINREDERTLYKQTAYHPGCFACVECKSQKLTGIQGFYVNGGRRFCLDCYNKHVAEKCSGCGQAIFDGGIRHRSRPFHRDCLKCAGCDVILNPQIRFVWRDCRTFCLSCFREKFAEKCAGCSENIQPEEAHLMVEGRRFHTNCLVCAICEDPLQDNPFVADVNRNVCVACSTNGFVSYKLGKTVKTSKQGGGATDGCETDGIGEPSSASADADADAAAGASAGANAVASTVATAAASVEASLGASAVASAGASSDATEEASAGAETVITPSEKGIASVVDEGEKEEGDEGGKMEEDGGEKEEVEGEKKKEDVGEKKEEDVGGRDRASLDSGVLPASITSDATTTSSLTVDERSGNQSVELVARSVDELELPL